MGKKEDKTNVMRVLDSLKLPYEHFEYEKTASLQAPMLPALWGKTRTPYLKRL